MPFYGWYLGVMTGIKIDRKGGATALRNLIKQAKNYLQEKHTVIIFPQGTRVPIGGSLENYPYQAGITALYTSCNVPIVPAALNSGRFWPKHKVRKNAGTITLEFLDPIYPGLSKQEFNQKLIAAIETRSTELSYK